MHRGHGAPIGLSFFVFDQVIDSAHVAAHRAGREKIEEHADQIVLDQVFKRRFDAEGPREHRPTHRADSLGNQVHRERHGDIREFRRREGLQEPLDVNAREKITDQPRADEKLNEKDDDGFGFVHPSRGGWMSASALAFGKPSTQTLRPTILRRPSA